MEDEKLLEIYNELLELGAKGDDAKAMEVVQERFKEMPEDMQAELLTRLYFKSLEDKAEEADIIAQVQEAGINEIERLENLKKTMEEESK